MKGERINCGQLKEVLPIPDLINIQTKSYSDFLQMNVAPEERKRQGLQEVFMDTFPPRDSGSKNAFELEFVKYDITTKPADMDLQEQLKTGGTYQGELWATFRMKGASAKGMTEKTIRMGHIPLMTPSGSFIINGTERVIVSQLHRSPGVCFEVNKHPSGKMLYSFKIIADHGSWLEVQFDVKDFMYIYLDRKRRRRKFLISTFLRAFGYNNNRDILDAVYHIQRKSVKELLADAEPARFTTAEPVTDPADNTMILLDALEPLNREFLMSCKELGVKHIDVVQTDELGDSFVKCLQHDTTVTCEDAQKEIYKRMRPSDPANAQNAKNLFEKMFQDERRYDLGLVGRFKMNQNLGINVDPSIRTLTKDDIAASTRRLMFLRSSNGRQDDIDHLSRRRIRTIGELLQNQCRVGLNRVASVARDKLNNFNSDGEQTIDRVLGTPKGFENAVTDFFQHNQLSQFMDQTNCLSELTNKRRLSALGPGGLTRDRAGTEVRDVHTSHYGRICPIETPEGPNIGLISSLALYAKLDDFGFIMTPYCRVQDGKVISDKKGKPEIIYMKADQEEDRRLTIYVDKRTFVDQMGNVLSMKPSTDAREETVTILCTTADKKDAAIVMSRKLWDKEPEADLQGWLTRLMASKHGEISDFLEEQGSFTYTCKPSGVKITMKQDDLMKLHGHIVIAQANAPRDENGAFINPYVLGRCASEAGQFPAEDVDFIDVSPKQMISAAASVITFLEHDDANRALMGCNMQRQAVPLMKPERPLVGTGMEDVIARYSHAIQTAAADGIVAWADGFKIIITADGKLPAGKTQEDFTVGSEDPACQVYILYKFLRSNACTLVNQRPLVRVGDKIKAGQPLADGACTDEGELALGRNVLVAFLPWRGYNFEDAIIISEKLVQDDVYTSIHINLQEVEAREIKKGGTEEITRDIPNVSQEALRNLDTQGVIRIGSEVTPGDVLVGKVSPKNEGELAPEERLLKAIFGEKSADVKDTSLKTENGNDGVVMDVRCKHQQNPDAARMNKAEVKARQTETRNKYKNERAAILDELVKELSETYLGQKINCTIVAENSETHQLEEIIQADRKITKLMLNNLATAYDRYQMKECEEKNRIDAIIKQFRSKFRDNEQCCKEAIELLQQNNGADPGVIRSVKVYIASKRRLSIGDKMAGRHGNKGIVSKIVPIADLPFMADGTPVEIILNPLGVPSRMNIGQVFETHAGWAAKVLGINLATPSFDGLPEDLLQDLMERARLVKVAQAAGVEIPESIVKDLRKTTGTAAAEAKQALRKLITSKGWTVGPRDDSKSTAGKVVDARGVDRTDDFIDIDGKIRLYDGRTGDAFAQRVMVGEIYMLKLDHLVCNKIHARAVGPYSLVTQQPLGGKAQHGGQRFGEMEVWALEAYGAAYTLQEMLTVKSDDVIGRTKIYDSIMRGNNELDPGVPESFNVLLREMMSLCLDVRINHVNNNMA